MDNLWFIVGIIALGMILADMTYPKIKKDSELPRARYPTIPKELCRVVPRKGDFLLGKHKNRYVCADTSEDAHFLIVGGTGSGKSSCHIIPTIMLNTEETAIFAIDIKGELSSKAADRRDEATCIMDIQDRDSYGYDPFFLLNKESSGQEIFETMQTIVYSLLPMPKNSSQDAYWVQSARNYLLGLFIYFYQQGYLDMVSIIDEILSQSATELIDAVISTEQPGKLCYKFMIEFKDLAEETLGGIVSQANNVLILFSADNDIRYVLRDNPRKLTPCMLEEKKNIFLTIREEKLAAYNPVLQLILNQVLGEMEKRPEEANPVLFIIDELPRILSAGKLEKLMDATKTLRSRNVRLVLVTQSLEALMTAYSENETIDLLTNCSYKIILDASSEKTQNMVCSWIGQYKERKQSVTGGGTQRRTTVSYEEKNIVTPAELMKLKKTGEVIIIASDYGYMRIRKCPYYRDTFFKKQKSQLHCKNGI